jgi:transcription elongation factor GreB
MSSKKELRGLDRCIHYLRNRFLPLKIIFETPEVQDRVFLAAWVKLEKEAGEKIIYRIVGSDELNPNKNHISLNSPMAKASLKKNFQRRSGY